MIDYIAAIRSESARFHELITGTAMDAPVPSCPDWTVADLAWHLTEVQHFWISIVDGLLTVPDTAVDMDRPADAELPALFGEQSARLVAVLERRHPDDECWSWHDAGHSVGWVRRRQAQEALIHRVDAELAAGTEFDADPVLAADGVDEILRYMLDLDNLPEWATYDRDGSTAVIELTDVDGSWAIDFGQMRGTSPDGGKSYDLPAVQLIGAPDHPTATLRGAAVDVDLWLWGRGPLDPIAVEGDRSVAELLRATAADSTQ